MLQIRFAVSTTFSSTSNVNAFIYFGFFYEDTIRTSVSSKTDVFGNVIKAVVYRPTFQFRSASFSHQQVVTSES